MNKYILVISMGLACVVGGTALADTIIDELVPSTGCYGGTMIKVIGSGFGDQRSGRFNDNEGYYSFATFTFNDAPDPGTMIATEYPLWSDTEVHVIFAHLFIDQNENYILDGNEPFLTGLDTGDYIVTVHAIRFHDNNGNGVYDEEDDVLSDTFSSEMLRFSVGQATISVCLIPDDSLFYRDETLGFKATITNNSAITTTVFFATKIVEPDGKWYPPSGYLFGPKRVTLSAYESKSAYIKRPVPQTATLGDYEYWGAVSLYGVGIIDVDHFNFQVGTSHGGSSGECKDCHYSGSEHHGGGANCIACHSF